MTDFEKAARAKQAAGKPLDENEKLILGLLPGDLMDDCVLVHPTSFPCTDLGNGERLVARFRDRIRYCPPRDKWFFYDDRRWAEDETGEIVRLAKRTVRAIFGEAEHATDKEHAQAIAKHAVRSEQAERIAAMIKLAKTEPGIAVMPHELDANPWLFNVRNGTLDLKTGKLRPHRRADLITKISPVSYDPAATSLLWDQYLTDATGGDAELAAYLQRAVGYAMQGTVAEKAFWFLYGPPDGMKSTFIRTIEAAFGEYAVPTSFETWLVQSSTGGNRGDLVRLLGARLVTSVEVRKGARFDEAILKAVTGDDAITAAAKYESEITFYATFALWQAGNDAPTVRDDDTGLWSRIRRVPFTNPLPKEKQDPTMREKLRAPEVLSAVLAWAVKGCLDWQKSGIGTCAAVEKSSAAYRAEMDRVAGFFVDRCVFDAAESVNTTVLRDAYENWCREQGIKHPVSGKDFGARLRERGCEPTKSGSARFWRGVRLLRDEEDSTDSRDTTPRKFSTKSSQEILWGTAAAAALPSQDDIERDAIQTEGGAAE